MKFCPKCGKNTDELVHGLCKECYFAEHDIIEHIKETNIEICEECGRIKTHIWAHIKEPDFLERLIQNNIKLKRGVVLEKMIIDSKVPKKLPNNNRSKAEAKVKIKAKVDGEKISMEYGVPFSALYTRCPECMKINNGYYEGVLQLRPRNHSSFEEAREFVRIDIAEQKRYGVAIVDEEELPEGIDFQVSKKIYLRTLAKKILKRFGGTVDTHFKLVTYDKQESKDLTRLTVLVRLPKFESGDVIEIKNKIVLVSKINKQSVFGLELENQKKVNYNHKEFKPVLIKKKKDMDRDKEGNFIFTYEDKTYKIAPDEKDSYENDDDDFEESDKDYSKEE